MFLTCVPMKAARDIQTVHSVLGKAHTVPMHITDAMPIPVASNSK